MKDPFKLFIFAIALMMTFGACEVNEVLPGPNDQNSTNTSDTGGGGDDEDPIIHLNDSTGAGNP